MVSYINDNREVVLEHTAMEIATATRFSDATVVRAIQALGFAGLRELKQTMERWFAAPPVTSAGKVCSTVTALSSDVKLQILILCLEGHQRVCEVLSRADNRCGGGSGGGIVTPATRARWGSSVSGASGILAEYTRPVVSAVLACRRA